MENRHSYIYDNFNENILDDRLKWKTCFVDYAEKKNSAVVTVEN